ncbi:MAG: Flagellar hook protein FlgE [Burkholderia gladioli]|nr:MAG: Flagellar hook protein FlgE [Burkholderia gladioli]
MQAHDSLGNPQNVNLYFVKSATTGAWNVYAGADGAPPANLGTIAFNTSGRLTGSTDASGAATPQTIALDLSGSTQFSTGKSASTNLVADSYATGSLTSYSVGVDGSLSGIYSNGKTMTLGQVVVNFNNPSGLTSIGGNQYLQTAASGVPQIGVAGTTNHGALKGGTTEASTTDLTGELVNLITAQRDYQANAQTIKTQRTVDQTLINL